MGRWMRWLLIGAVSLWCLPGIARAESEVDVLLNMLVENGTLTPVQAGQVRRQISETKEARNKQLAKEIVPDSARNWKWKGDVRLRDEFRDRQGTGNDTHRQRIRFQFGAEGKVAEDLKATFRIATGSTTDPVSTNQNLDTFFGKKALVLDLANLEYTPEVPGISKVSLIGGIMENPLWTTDPMVWDGDLSWDGAAVKVSQEMGPTTLFANSGVFSLDTDETEPAALWVTQLGASVKPFADSESEVLKNFKLTGALAYHDYMNVTTSAKAGTDPITREADNTAGATDFNQFNPTVELASQLGQIPFSFFGDWVHNTSAPSTGNDGYALGIKVGKATVPWSLTKGWEAGYMFERLERDAAFDEFVDSDFGGGGTNRRGNVVWLNLAVLKNSTLGAKLFFRQDLIDNFGSGASLAEKFREDRLQMDWVTKF